MTKFYPLLAMLFMSFSTLKAQLYFSEDFSAAHWQKTVSDSNLCIPDSLPEGWMVYDSLALKQYWHWSKQGPRGVYTSVGPDACNDPNNAVLAQMQGSWQNGFMMLESDFFNTLDGCIPKTSNNLINSAIQFGPVDLTESDSPQLLFNAFGSFCCEGGEFAVMVSVNFEAQNPQLATWQNINIPVSTDSYLNQNVLINLPQIAANNPNVYIRVMNRNFSNQFVVIDDIQVKEAPEYELSLNDYLIEYGKVYEPQSTWTDWDKKYKFEGGYTQIPKSMVSEFVGISADVTNNGSKAQTATLGVTIFKSEEPTYTNGSSAFQLAFLEQTSLTLTTDFTPVDEGFYQISATVSSLPNQQNHFGYEFEVTQHQYSRVNMANSSKFILASPSDFVIGGNDGDMVARHYLVPEGVGQQFAGSISFYLTSYTNYNMIPSRTAIKEGRFNVRGHLFKAVEGKDWLPGSLVASSELYNIALTDLNTWVTLPLFDEGNLLLEHGVYFAAIEISNGNLRFELGADPTAPKQPFNGGQLYSQSQAAWYNAQTNYAINLNLQALNTVGANESAELIIWPNPSTGDLHVSANESLDRIEICSLDGNAQPLKYDGEKIDVSSYETGLYLIRVTYKNGQIKTMKFIKE